MATAPWRSLSSRRHTRRRADRWAPTPIYMPALLCPSSPFANPASPTLRLPFPHDHPCRVQISDDNLRKTMKVLDKNGDGMIDLEETPALTPTAPPTLSHSRYPRPRVAHRSASVCVHVPPSHTLTPCHGFDSLFRCRSSRQSLSGCRCSVTNRDHRSESG